MKVAIYARVSSEKQAEKDLSIPAQLKSLKKYAIDRNWDIVNEYVDEAESARSANRPAFQEMIAEAKKKEKPFDAILVWKLSRFARNREDSIIYKSLLKKRGIAVASINEQIDDTASGRLLEGMIEVIDEFYSASLAQDTMRGMKENGNRGYFNGGIIPFGYQKTTVMVGVSRRAKLEPNPKEAPIVKRAFELALEGEGAKEIAKVLNSGGYRTRAGKLFGTTTINFWLKNPVYAGNFVWNRTDRTGSRVFSKKPAELIIVPNAYEALISHKDFQHVQRQLFQRRPKISSPRSVSSSFLLTSFSFCGKCGAGLIGTSAKSGHYDYYECNGRYKKGEACCKGVRVAKAKLEGFVIDRIRNCILTEKNLLELVLIINNEFLSSGGRLNNELSGVEAELLQVSARLAKLYSSLEDGKLTVDDLAPRIKELRASQHELQGKRQELINQIEEGSTITMDEATAKAYVEELKRVLIEGSFIHQKAILRKFVKRVELGEKAVTIEYSIPLENEKTSEKEVLDIKQIGSGGWIRTNGLRVMSPTSFHCSTPRC